MAFFVEIEPGLMLNVESIAFMFRLEPEKHDIEDYEGREVTVINTTGGQCYSSKTPKEINSIIQKIITDIRMKSARTMIKVPQ